MTVDGVVLTRRDLDDRLQKRRTRDLDLISRRAPPAARDR